MQDGAKVKVMVRFRGREIVHAELGRVRMMQLYEAVREYANLNGNRKLKEKHDYVLSARKQRKQGAKADKVEKTRGIIIKLKGAFSMPKMKTQRAAKRFKVTGNGLIKRKCVQTPHFRRARNRKGIFATPSCQSADAKRIKKMLAISLTFDIIEEEGVLKMARVKVDLARRRHKDFEIGQGLPQRPAPSSAWPMPKSRSPDLCLQGPEGQETDFRRL